jgi:hypothetical protein
VSPVKYELQFYIPEDDILQILRNRGSQPELFAGPCLISRGQPVILQGVDKFVTPVLQSSQSLSLLFCNPINYVYWSAVWGIDTNHVQS